MGNFYYCDSEASSQPTNGSQSLAKAVVEDEMISEEDLVDCQAVSAIFFIYLAAEC